ncbi:580_t:CDS:2, partial [Scutellospora calospora]
TIGISKVLTSSTKCKHAVISGVTKCEIYQKLSAPNPPKQKDLVPEYNISEQAVSDIWWLQYAFAKQMLLSDEVLIEKAKSIASHLVSESESSPSKAELSKEHKRLHTIIAQYPLDDVWNADET